MTTTKKKKKKKNTAATKTSESWVSSVVSRWATVWMIRGSSPDRVWDFFSSPPRPDRLWSPPSLLFSGSYSGCKAAGREAFPGGKAAGA
jgi:hypothetical protein